MTHPLPHPSRSLSRWLLAAAGLVCVVGAARAQDPAFSQYTAAPIYNSPALVGVFEGDFRLTANYRDQWASSLDRQPLRSYAASGELRYDLGGRDYFAGAVSVLHDAGGAAQFATTNVGLGVAGHKYLAGGRGRDAVYLGFGGRVGYGQHRLSGDGLWFSSQFDTLGVVVGETGSPLPANFDGGTRGYLDASTGVSLTVVQEKYSLWLSLAGHHLNRPDVSFLSDAQVLLDSRFNVMTGGEWIYNRELRILPSASLDIQGSSRRISAGASVYYQPDLSGDAGFRMGAYARSAARNEGPDALESVIFSAMVEASTLSIGLSYDVNVGEVARVTDGRGAFEVSLSFTNSSARRHKVICPKF